MIFFTPYGSLRARNEPGDAELLLAGE